MSYELDSIRKMKCPCEKGYIVEKNYSDDWGRFKNDFSIICNDCEEKYHIENWSYTKPDGEYVSTPYLVPNGQSINYSEYVSYNLKDTQFSIQLCMKNKKIDLQQAYNALKVSRYFSILEDEKAIYVCKMAKCVLRTVKLKIILPHVIEAIKNYDDVENNYEKNEIRVEKEKARVAETKKKSIYLYDLEKM